MNAIRSASSALVFLAVTAGASADVLVGSFFGDFNTTGAGNDYSVNDWLYGYSATSTSLATSTISAFTNYDSVGPDGIARWHSPSNENALVPAAFYNPTGSPVAPHGVGPGQAALHGGLNGDIGVASYLVQASSLYHITGTFLAGDSGPDGAGAVDNYVYAGGVQYVAALGQSGATSFDFYAYLTAGQKINFGVGTAGNYQYDSTPLQASISTVPSPLAALPFALGMLKRRRRKA